MQYLLAALGCLVTTTYWPGIAGAANSSRWIVLGCVSGWLLLYPERIRITAAHLAGALFVGWAFLTYLWSSSPQDTIGWGLRLAILAAVFCLGSMCRDMRPVYAGVTLGLIPSYLVAIAQFSGWHGIPDRGAPAGLFVNQNFYAEICALVAVALIAEKMWEWVPITAPGLLLTNARGALLGLAVALLAMAWHRKRRALFAAGLAAIVLMVSLSIAVKGGDSLLYRFNFWQATFEHLIVFGNGLGSYADAVVRFGSMITEHPHNEPLEIAFETGIFGLVLLAAFVAALLVRSGAWRIIGRRSLWASHSALGSLRRLFWRQWRRATWRSRWLTKPPVVTPSRISPPIRSALALLRRKSRCGSTPLGRCMTSFGG